MPWEVDDLSEDSGKRCARCGSGRELDRPNSLFLNGSFYGEIVCGPCLVRDPFELLRMANPVPDD